MRSRHPTAPGIAAPLAARGTWNHIPSMPDPTLIAVARGDRPADVLLRGARVPNVFTGEIEEIDVLSVQLEWRAVGLRERQQVTDQPAHQPGFGDDVFERLASIGELARQEVDEIVVGVDQLRSDSLLLSCVLRLRIAAMECPQLLA